MNSLLNPLIPIYTLIFCLHTKVEVKQGCTLQRAFLWVRMQEKCKNSCIFFPSFIFFQKALSVNCMPDFCKRLYFLSYIYICVLLSQGICCQWLFCVLPVKFYSSYFPSHTTQALLSLCVSPIDASKRSAGTYQRSFPYVQLSSKSLCS